MAELDFLFQPRNHKDISLWRDATLEEWNNPQWQIEHSIHDVETLSQVIELNETQKEGITNTLDTLIQERKKPLRITPYVASLMEQYPFDNPYPRGDPIFWQFVVTPAHLLFPNSGQKGAMEENKRRVGSAYQRYPGIVAFLIAGITICPNYCGGFCQRRNFTPENEANGSVTYTISDYDIRLGLYYISQNENAHEILITGGEPFFATRMTTGEQKGKSRLEYVLEELSKMEHVRVIRLATKVPVTLPMAITDDLLNSIKESVYAHDDTKFVYVMTHLNHYKEVTSQFRGAVRRILNHGFPVYNQLVALNHVNADYETMGNTLQRMLWAGNKPYYIMQCHNEKRLTHFIVPIEIMQEIVEGLWGWIPGICRGMYVTNAKKADGSGLGKVPLMPSGYNPQIYEEEIIPLNPSATLRSWTGDIINNYKVLGTATSKEVEKAKQVMKEFIGKDGVFNPYVIIEDGNQAYVYPTDARLPKLTNREKAELLGYKVGDDGMPITNPKMIEKELLAGFESSPYSA